jgi:hypothetical protein
MELITKNEELTKIEKSRAAVSAYQKNNKDAVNLKMRRYYDRIKADPERHSLMKERQRKRYLKVKEAKAIKDIVE